MKKREYTGTVYIGAVGGDTEYGIARDSIERIVRWPGDDPPRMIRATKGYEARQMHFDNFIDNTRHDFMLLLDSDMVFSNDTLHQLRSHKMPYLTGAYMRRQYSPMAPVYFEGGPKLWPRVPSMNYSEKSGLVERLASGWGCIFIHREVILETRKQLKGEPDVIEDDMDVYPYNLYRIMGAINGLQALVDEKPSMKVVRPALEKFTQALVEEIRPLRGFHSVVGSDIRYPFFARLAGYKLYLDPKVKASHILNYPLSMDDYVAVDEDIRSEVDRNNKRRVNAERRQWRKRLKELKQAEL